MVLLAVALVGLCRFVVCAFGVVTDVMRSFDVAVESVVLRASSVDWCTVPVFDMVTCAMGVVAVASLFVEHLSVFRYIRGAMCGGSVLAIALAVAFPSSNGAGVADQWSRECDC